MSILQIGLEKMEVHLVQVEQVKTDWLSVSDIARENLQREIQHTKVDNSYRNYECDHSTLKENHVEHVN